MKEWQKLSPPIKEQFKKKLQARILDPHHQPSCLRGYKQIYKIKLRAQGYRLIYEVDDQQSTSLRWLKEIKTGFIKRLKKEFTILIKGTSREIQ